jgi:hypothetical protein
MNEKTMKDLEKDVMRARSQYTEAKRQFEHRSQRVAAFRGHREDIERAVLAEENAAKQSAAETRKTLRGSIVGAVLTRFAEQGRKELNHSSIVAELQLKRDQAATRGQKARELGEELDALLAEEMELLFAAEVVYSRAHRELSNAIKAKRQREVVELLRPLVMDLRAAAGSNSATILREMMQFESDAAEKALQAMLGDVPRFAERSGEFAPGDLDLHAKCGTRSAEASKLLAEAAA